MAQKIENWQFPIEGIGGKNNKDYSVFLEQAEKEKRSKEDIIDRIKERTKFLEIEEAKLAILEENPASNAKKIEEQQKLVDNINDEVMELSKKISGMDEKAELYFEGDEEAIEKLERFKPEIEN
ncbi:MAG: hypothetical protein WC608_03695 [Parcubacteria group bacterium]